MFYVTMLVSDNAVCESVVCDNVACDNVGGGEGKR